MIEFAGKRFLYTGALALALAPVAGPAFGVSIGYGCPSSSPTISGKLFQQAIDATIPFDLQVVAMRSPANNNLSLLYRAVQRGKVVGYNPTLVVRVGAPIDNMRMDTSFSVGEPLDMFEFERKQKDCRDFCRDTSSKRRVFLSSPYILSALMDCCKPLKSDNIEQS